MTVPRVAECVPFLTALLAGLTSAGFFEPAHRYGAFLVFGFSVMSSVVSYYVGVYAGERSWLPDKAHPWDQEGGY